MSRNRGVGPSPPTLAGAAGMEAPLPAGASFNPGVSLLSVSCASAGNCAAAGYYTGTPYGGLARFAAGHAPAGLIIYLETGGHAAFTLFRHPHAVHPGGFS